MPASSVQITGSPGRKSPSRSPIKMSPDINRAVARELYIDSTVNVVNKVNGKPNIKPGQMNLFNPKG